MTPTTDTAQNKFYAAFRADLTAYLTINKISQGDFAERLGKSHSWLSRIITGQADPSEPVLMAVSEIPGMEHCYPDYLYAKAQDWGGRNDAGPTSAGDISAVIAIARARILELQREVLKSFDEVASAVAGKDET